MTLRSIAQTLVAARSNRLAGNVARANWSEERAEEALRRLFESLGGPPEEPFADLCAASVRAAMVANGVPAEDLNGACDGDSIELLVDSLCSAWECCNELTPLDCDEWWAVAQVLEEASYEAGRACCDPANGLLCADCEAAQ